MPSSSELEGKAICFTGTLKTLTRVQATAAAKQHGARVTTAISGKTDILVAGAGSGGKVRQAKSKKIQVWTEDEFKAAVGSEDDEEEEEEEEENEEKEEKKRGKKNTKPPAAARGKKTKAKTAPESPPAKKAKKSAEAKTPPPPATDSAKKMAPATPSTDGTVQRKVMSAVSNAHEFTVHNDYDVKLMLSDSLGANSNKFYKLQLLYKTKGHDRNNYFVATNWGRLGESGQNQVKGPFGDAKGIAEFSKVFRNKTRNEWGSHPFVRHSDKYQIVETTLDDGGDDSNAALGRLTESQIHKGQAVLKEIREILEEMEKKPKAGKRAKTNPNNATKLGSLSNDFYSLIPTTSGRQKPPRLDNLEIITEKDGLLEFWLRMGFEEVSDVNLDGSPIEKVFDLPVPATLEIAASNITDKGSIKSSQDRAGGLAKEQAGKPNKDMGKELYAAILLYTGNSIYRELNRCLRTEWKSVPKYWNYLRLYFEAMYHMPTREVTLWRGIAVDLYEEYEVGKVITWWTVSSCTADKSVAENFMNQLGGSAASLFTLHTKTACDISGLSFFPHEKESLLRPGTKLRVLNRKRKGKVAEIEVEEVVDEQ